MATYQYNPADISVNLDHDPGGPHTLMGFAPDTFVTVEAVEETWTSRSSADGKVVTRSKRNNPLVTVTFVLEAGSPSNDYLQSRLADDRTNNGGLLNVKVTDDNGLEEAHVPQAWVTRQPGLSYGADASTRSWTLQGAGTIDVRGSSEL